MSGGVLSIAFTRLRPDVTYTVQVSDDLVDWDDLSVNPGEIGGLVVVDDPSWPALPKRFLRIEIQLTAMP